MNTSDSSKIQVCESCSTQDQVFNNSFAVKIQKYIQKVKSVILYGEWMNETGFRIYTTAIVMVTFLLLTACAAGQKKGSSEVPKWLSSPPVDDQYFYAIVISGRTRSVKDAWIQAANRARAELGRTIVSHVSSKDLIVSTTRGEYSRQLIDILSDTELNYTEIIKRWYDPYGNYGPPNHYYVLIRMSKETAVTVLNNLK